MSVFKNLIFLPLGLIAACSCLPDFPWWLELIYFHLLLANEISLTFLHETLQRILLTVLNSFPPFWQLYAQWGVVRGCGEFSGCTWAQLHPQEIGPLGFASFSQLYLLQCLFYWVYTLHLRVYTPSQISVASLLSLQRSAPPKRLRFGGKSYVSCADSCLPSKRSFLMLPGSGGAECLPLERQDTAQLCCPARARWSLT